MSSKGSPKQHTRNRGRILEVVNLKLDKLRLLLRLSAELQLLDQRRYEQRRAASMRLAVWSAAGSEPIVVRRHPDLFDGIADFAALVRAARRAIRGKRAKPGAAAFMAGLETEVLRLERELRSGTWRPGRYVEIEVFVPKHRIVSAAPFCDRVVHHALCAVVEPIFERGFIFDSYANRAGKGTHKAVARYERCRDRHRHVLGCDIYRYFPAIDHQILKDDLRRRIACPRTLWLVDAVIDGSNPQEPVHLHYPGDDLLTPLTRRRGLPIGNLTSQFFVNVYLDGLDHFIKEVLGAPYLRYVDDFALFDDDPAVLAEWQARIAAHLARRRLSLHPGKTRIVSTQTPATFLGFVLLPGGRRRLPEENVRRFHNRLRGLRDRYHAGTVDPRPSHAAHPLMDCACPSRRHMAAA
jgi:RNA-directed DNA polymerase